MWTFLGRPECILYLSSALSAMALPSYNKLPRLNQTHLTPSLLVTREAGLKVEGSQFTLGRSPFRIISGTIDYFRIPRQNWRISLRKMRSCGFNTLTTHVPWNLHEPAADQFYFTGNLDLLTFITIASEEGLWVILCAGPYVGSDLDLGGLPSWLLKDPHMKLRTTYKGFTTAMNRYFDHLVPRIAQFQYRKGGPIIAVQIENEYGSYYMDRKYMAYVKKALVSRGISELLMTADDGLNLRKGHLKNVLATVHMKNIMKKTYDDLEAIQGRSPILMMVYTTNSFDTWGVLRHFGEPQILMKDVNEMILLGFSFNIYMFHGGTNFGFIGGALSSDGYLPAVTSYDYSALLTEDGTYTPEYAEFQELFHYITDVSTIIQPKTTQKTAYKPLILLYFMTLWDVLPHLDLPTKSVKPIPMELLPVNEGNGQSFGYTLYETIIFKGGLLTSKGHIQDHGQMIPELWMGSDRGPICGSALHKYLFYALRSVFLDNKYIGALNHYNNQLLIVKNSSKITQTLRILVENQGRLTSGKAINQERKGLTGEIYLDDIPLRHFLIYSLELQNSFIQRNLPKIWKVVTKHVAGPAFFLSHLRVGDTPQDTFLKVKGWRKGVVFINGQILGRYWDIGPQETLYVPGAWLHPGVNEIIMFEELQGGLNIHFTNQAQLGY